MQVSFYYYFLRFPDGPLGTAKIQRNALPAKNKVKIKKCDPIVIEVVCPCLEGGKKCPSESQRGQQQESVCFLGGIRPFFVDLVSVSHLPPLPPESPTLAMLSAARSNAQPSQKTKLRSAETSHFSIQHYEMQHY